MERPMVGYSMETLAGWFRDFAKRDRLATGSPPVQRLALAIADDPEVLAPCTRAGWGRRCPICCSPPSATSACGVVRGAVGMAGLRRVSRRTTPRPAALLAHAGAIREMLQGR